MAEEFRKSQSYKAQLDKARCWCAAEERCESGVREKLVAWGAGADDADEIVAALREEGYLDDVRYARAYCESKVLHQHWGRQKVLYQLRLKRLPREAIEEGMAAVDEEQYMEMLEETAARKLRELGGKCEAGSGELGVTEKRKMMAFLASRGFTMSEINEVITKIKKTMKRIITICAALIMVATVATAQDDAAPARGTWGTSSTPALKVSEQIFNNWSKSGNSTFDVTSSFFGNYKYTHPKYVWDNVVDLAYGYAWQDLDPEGVLFETRRKSNDKIDLTSALSWNAYKGWGASFTANLKTQFGRGYEYDGVGKAAEETKQLVSDFFAPAYLTTALSFEYKKPDWSVALSFLTGKTTFVCNDWFIINGYNYGVIQNDPDDPKKPFDPANEETYKNIKNAYFALGSYIKAQYLKKDLVPNLDLYARIELFYDYQKPKNMGWKSIEQNDHWWDGTTGAKTKYTGVETTDQFGFDRLKGMNWLKRRAFETDIDMELKLDYRFSSHIAANFALNLKYDTDFAGMGRGGHWQLYQLAGVQLFFNWATPKK